MANVSGDINYCISCIDRIVKELDNIANELPTAINGVSVSRIQANLRDCAKRYRRARHNLSSIHRG